MKMETKKDLFWEWVCSIGMILLLCLVFGNLCSGFYGFITKGSENPDDFIMRYRESKYLYQSINPFDVIYGEREVDSRIGFLWDVAGYTPWGMAYGIVFNFIFFPEKYARYLFFLCYMITMLLAIVVSYYLVRKVYSKRISRLIVLLILANPGWSTGLSWLNVGAILGILIFFGVLLLDRFPVIAGIFIGLAAAKPQLAAPFFLGLLLKKQWKAFMSAVLVPLIGWGIAIFLTGTSPFFMLLQFQVITEKFSGMLGNWITSLSIYYDINFNHPILQFVGMISCIVFAGYIWNLMKKNAIYDNLTFFSVAAILSGMWTYSQAHDRTVLTLVILCLSLKGKELLQIHRNYLIVIGIFIFSCIVDVGRFVRVQSFWISVGSAPSFFYELLKNITWVMILLFLAYFKEEKS